MSEGVIISRKTIEDSIDAGTETVMTDSRDNRQYNTTKIPEINSCDNARIVLENSKNRSQRKRTAIIFDLDGTLWDATGCSVDIWNRVLVWEINRFDRQIKI